MHVAGFFVFESEVPGGIFAVLWVVSVRVLYRNKCFCATYCLYLRVLWVSR